MMRLPMALALSTLCLTSCAKPDVRAVAVTPDPAPLASCPRVFPAPPRLKPLEGIVLPDGRVAVLMERIIEREQATAKFIVEGRGAWHACMSSVVWFEDWSLKVGGQR